MTSAKINDVIVWVKKGELYTPKDRNAPIISKTANKINAIISIFHGFRCDRWWDIWKSVAAIVPATTARNKFAI